MKPKKKLVIFNQACISLAAALQYVSFCLGNGLAPSWWQFITWTRMILFTNAENRYPPLIS